MDKAEILQLLDEAIANRESDAHNGVEDAQEAYRRGNQAVTEFTRWFLGPQRKEHFLSTVFVTTLTVLDPDTQNPCEIEIRKIQGGPLVGLDGAYLHDIGGSDPLVEYPVSPYDGTPLLIPDDEDKGT